MPGGHLNLDHRIHEHVSTGLTSERNCWVSQPIPANTSRKRVSRCSRGSMLRLGALVHEKHEEFAHLRRAIGRGLASRLVIHLVGAADAVAIGKRIAGDGVAQIAAELLFGPEDQGTRGGMHAIGANQQIKGLGRAIIERHLHRILPWYNGNEPTTKPHLDLPSSASYSTSSSVSASVPCIFHR